jgi:hypothetical protein
MQAGIILIWSGAILMIAGIVYSAARALWHGRMSAPRPPSAAVGGTLEPRTPSAGLDFAANWPGLALIGLGALLLLAAAFA